MNFTFNISDSLIYNNCNSFNCMTIEKCNEISKSLIMNQSKYFLIFLFLFYVGLIFYDSKIFKRIEKIIFQKSNFKIKVDIKKIIFNFIKYSSLIILIYELFIVR